MYLALFGTPFFQFYYQIPSSFSTKLVLPTITKIFNKFKQKLLMTMKITTDRSRKTEKSHLLYTSVVIRIVSEWLKPSLLCRRCIRCYGLRFTQTESFITKCTKIYLIDFCSYFVVIKYNDDATVDTHVDNHLTRSHYLTVFHFTRSTIS